MGHGPNGEITPLALVDVYLDQNQGREHALILLHQEAVAIVWAHRQKRQAVTAAIIHAMVPVVSICKFNN